MARVRCLGLIAVAVLAVEAGSGRADLPGPWPSPSKRRPVPAPPAPEPQPVPAPPQPPTDPSTGRPMGEFREEKPKRTGPFRSCGSGMGTGLVGIAAAWGVLWLGNRFAGRWARGSKSGCAG
jgi:hypothetical protein